jgi:hypothetical protein
MVRVQNPLPAAVVTSVVYLCSLCTDLLSCIAFVSKLYNEP